MLGILLVLAVACGVVFGVWSLFSFLFSHLQKEVSAAIVTASATVIVAVVTVVGGRLLERRNISQRAQQEKRVPIYEEFVTDLFKSFGIGLPRDGRPPVDATLAARVYGEFSTRIVVWGSDEVLKRWVSLRNHFQGPPGGVRTPDYDFQGLVKLEELLVALRKDLGLSGNSLKRGDVLGAIVTDLDWKTGSQVTVQGDTRQGATES